MAKQNKLKDRFLSTNKEPGLYNDGNGLWFRVTESLSKNWVFRYTFDGKRRHMGLGAYPDISLEEARDRATDYRRTVRSGIDPIEQRKLNKATQRAERSNSVTFAYCAERYIEAMRHEWKNAKHAQQWTNTLKQYAYPIIGGMLVKEVETAHILRILEPIWTTKTETASRVRARLENVLDWATTHNYRTGDNPARWKAHLENLLAKPSKVKRIEHHAALPYTQMFDFMHDLHQHDCVSAMALEFAILTATRTNEVIGAKWNEIDLQSKVWTIPLERMKAAREHRVPLSNKCVEILTRAANIRQSDYVFPGGRESKGLSNIAMVKLLQKTMSYDCTVHGFRSSFRDWAGERTHYPRDLCEMALAHTIKDKAEAAYRRGDMIEKRRQMMQDWEKFCSTPTTVGNVIPIGKSSLQS
jgi:integrase